jgi:hypothetical protein
MINLKLGELYGFKTQAELMEAIDNCKSIGMTDDAINAVLKISECKINSQISEKKSEPESVSRVKFRKIPEMIEGWESPIKAFEKQYRLNYEDSVVKAVQEIGIHVDKQELLKALDYDRGQYDKGYINGYTSGFEKGRQEAVQELKNNLIKMFGGTDEDG